MKVISNSNYEIIHSGTYLITASENSIKFKNVFNLEMTFIAEKTADDNGNFPTWVKSKMNDGLVLSLYNFFDHDSANSKGFNRFFRKKVVGENCGVDSYYLAFFTQKLSPASISLTVNFAKHFESSND